MPYLMHEGDGKRIAIYSCCEDILLAKSELLLLRDEALKMYPNANIYAYVDSDPSFTIRQFKKAYRGDYWRYKALMAKRIQIVKEGWPYIEVDLSKREDNNENSENTY